VAQRCLPFLDSILDGNFEKENNNNSKNDNNNNIDKKAKKQDVSKSVNTKILAMKCALTGKGKKTKALIEGDDNGGEGPGVKEVM
jgi:polyphosphate kinase 2 (PPK2 family)